MKNKSVRNMQKFDFNFATKLSELAYKAPTKKLAKRITSIYKSYMFKTLKKKEKAKIVLKNIFLFLVLLVLLAALYFAITLLIGLIML